ncbi:MAG: FCD domain-containing protein [Acidimicrobiales bacterium]
MDLWKWYEALEEDTERGAAEDYFWHNVGFRLCEIRLSGSEELQRVLGGFGLRTLRFRHLSLTQPGRLRGSLDKHRRLLTAYEKGDRDRAVEMTRGLIIAGYQTLAHSGLIAPSPTVPSGSGREHVPRQSPATSVPPVTLSESRSSRRVARDGSGVTRT